MVLVQAPQTYFLSRKVILIVKCNCTLVECTATTMFICLQTYVGSILVAVNPYKMYDMYGLDVVKKYEGQILGTLPP